MTVPQNETGAPEVSEAPAANIEKSRYSQTSFLLGRVIVQF